MLSKEELRKARLATLCSSSNSDTGQHVDKKPNNISSDISRSLPPPPLLRSRVSEGEIREAYRVMYEGGGCTREDLSRWYDQGFVFCSHAEGGLAFGLAQTHGGPCGVLAPVQAEIIRELIEANASSDDVIRGDCLPELTESQVDGLFGAALLRILRRASSSDRISFVIYVGSSTLNPSTQASELEMCTLSADNSKEVGALLHEILPRYKSKAGCMLFLLSVLFTRGLENIRDDMDAMSGNTLIGQYGHCNQDLINLLLTGSATSNVMDGDVNIGGQDDRLMIKGVSRRSTVGYLTHLESLRLCQVGSFYKTPECPIWVVGSASHFTVLFSFDSELNKESEAEQLLAEARRAFRLVDPDDCGYVSGDRLVEVLRSIRASAFPSSIALLLRNEGDIGRLRSRLEMDGGIVLWSSFWECVSQLMAGSSLDEVLLGAAAAAATPLMITNGPATPTNPTTRFRSDSEVARQLQDELNSGYFSSGNNPGSPTRTTFGNHTLGFDEMTSGGGPPSRGRARSDSELARELQEQWSREDDMLPALLPAEAPTLFPTDSNGSSSGRLHTEPAINSSSSEGVRDDYRRFVVYHFNGFERRGGGGRPPTLAKFHLLLPRAAPLLGQPLSSSSATSMYSGSPVEEVLRTRWAVCRVDWLGAAPPSID